VKYQSLSLRIGPPIAKLPGFATGVETATVTVPVKAFTCPNEEMREHLLEAMKADTFPDIVYRLEKYEVTPAQNWGRSVP
jgi:hypothetical protein